MANVAPPRFVRMPAAAEDSDLGPALREAFKARQDRIPAFLDSLLARIPRRRRRP